MVNELMREHRAVKPTRVERSIGLEEVIVSKTDTRGLITYANTVFCRISGYSLPELIGAPHNLIRHPDMPRCVFKFLWDRISEGHEVFAYVKNMARNGDFYWVLAHVTPTISQDSAIIGHHSNRRYPDPVSVSAVEPVYAQLRALEQDAEPLVGLERSMQALTGFLASKGVTYDEFIFSVIR